MKKSRILLAVLMIAVLAVNLMVFIKLNKTEDAAVPVSMAVSDTDAAARDLADQLYQPQMIAEGIQSDGMSVDRAAPGAVELGISQVDVYCRDRYQLVLLNGNASSWTSSNEEIATVDKNGYVNTKKAGQAVITVSDENGCTDSCVVNVIKVAYITVDDTPTEFTPRLLDILDEYGVKATFFMNADPAEADQYREIYERGHTFALHGYTHYTSYRSGAHFLENMENARQFIMEVTGCDSIDNILRFPTGSKGQNNYHEILEYIQGYGYSAFDWTTEFHDYYYSSAEGCLEYFKTYLRSDRAIVLFHPREWSVDALPEALDYIIEQGYTFAVITGDTRQYNFYSYYLESYNTK